MSVWEPFLWLVLIVMGVRWLARRRSRSPGSGRLPNVPDAPTDATPLIRPRLDDNGLGTYTLVIPGTERDL